jgi:hypothetical protein
MKNYVVAILSFFENEIKQFGIEAESPYEAIKKAMIEFTRDEYKQQEIDFQNGEEYPKTIKEMDEYFGNCDMVFSITEVGSFINN